MYTRKKKKKNPTDWGVCDFFRFCQSFTSNFPFSFPSPFDLSFALKKKRTLRIYPINPLSAKQSFQLWYPGGQRLKVISFS